MRRDFVRDSARKLKMRGDGTLPAAFMPQRLYEPDVTAGGTQNFFPRGFLRGVCVLPVAIFWREKYNMPCVP